MRMMRSPKSGMDLIVGHTVALDIGINRIPMLLVVTQGIEHLGKRDVRQADDNLFWGQTKFPQFRDGTNRRTGTRNDRYALENLVRSDNVRMLRGGCHQSFAPEQEIVIQPIGAQPRCQLHLGVQAHGPIEKA